MASTPQGPPTGPVSSAERLKLPGMLPQEIVIFRTWWASNGGNFDSAVFNLRVGQGVDPGPTVEEAARKGAILNSTLRIEALLTRRGLPTIVEVKYRATPQAVGQILMYRCLYLRDFALSPPPALLLLCFQVTDDAMYCAFTSGVKIVPVVADFTGIPVPPQ